MRLSYQICCDDTNTTSSRKMIQQQQLIYYLTQGTTSSSRDAFDLDGVKTGSNVDLTNNGTHNGFTITCNTQC